MKTFTSKGRKPERFTVEGEPKPFHLKAMVPLGPCLDYLEATDPVTEKVPIKDAEDLFRETILETDHGRFAEWLLRHADLDMIGEVAEWIVSTALGFPTQPPADSSDGRQQTSTGSEGGSPPTASAKTRASSTRTKPRASSTRGRSKSTPRTSAPSGRKNT